jgi:hypothetical protein
LEPSFRIEDSTASRWLLEGQLREAYGRAVYSHKTHEKCADILLARLGNIKFWQIVLSAITTCGFAATIFDSAKLLGMVGALVSTVLLVLNAYTKDYDLGAVAQEHKQAANDIWLIRERYLSLITDLRMKRRPLEDLLAARDELAEELHAVYAGSPSTTYKAYKEAQRALKVREDMTFSEGELDALLPHDMRRGGNPA